VEHALSPSIVGTVAAGQQDFEISMASDVDAPHFASDAAVEAFDHANGLGRIRARRAVNDFDFCASTFKIVGGEADPRSGVSAAAQRAPTR